MKELTINEVKEVSGALSWSSALGIAGGAFGCLAGSALTAPAAPVAGPAEIKLMTDACAFGSGVGSAIGATYGDLIDNGALDSWGKSFRESSFMQERWNYFEGFMLSW